jgi:hypothetical protein
MPPYIDLDGTSESRRRWQITRSITGGALFIGLAATTLRLGVQDHLWPLAIGILGIFAASLPLLVRFLRQRDRNAQASSPEGTLFTAGFSVSEQQLRDQPRFQMSDAPRRRTWGGRSGQLRLRQDGFHFDPTGSLGFGTTTIVVPWTEITALQLNRVPAKFNVAGLDLTLNDGSTITVEVRQYDWIRNAISALTDDNT